MQEETNHMQEINTDVMQNTDHVFTKDQRGVQLNARSYHVFDSAVQN